ncbi:hypothetical protein C1645_817465 [Glomus cerebriforme]|uniref:Uncharacterized protein n=1 Tax=Glomus cerebriforme TaxID=658196 RepID=A0A397T9E4_9GLOM|nr:hypothetical protein C1645_817465 [Glomus cerebriforme]
MSGQKQLILGITHCFFEEESTLVASLCLFPNTDDSNDDDAGDEDAGFFLPLVAFFHKLFTFRHQPIKAKPDENEIFSRRSGRETNFHTSKAQNTWCMEYRYIMNSSGANPEKADHNILPVSHKPAGEIQAGSNFGALGIVFFAIVALAESLENFFSSYMFDWVSFANNTSLQVAILIEKFAYKPFRDEY